MATWEPRSRLDRLSLSLYRGLFFGVHWIVVATAALITLALLVQPAVLVVEEPPVAAFFGLSIVPAAALAAFIWYADVTTNEPLGLLVATFVLAVLFATFAAVVNSVAGPPMQAILGPAIGSVLFFFLIVGPVEETVKLLAVRVFAYRSDTFDAVIDGAVYGAVAGLGFAAIENAIYISATVAEADAGLLGVAAGIATLRGLVGPGHVIYSAIAGYYLGLAKFNPEHAGPLVVKGLLIAAVVHATYNATVGVVPGLLTAAVPLSTEGAIVTYVIAYNVAIGYFLFRKLARYRRTYRTVRPTDGDPPAPERTEFDPDGR